MSNSFIKNAISELVRDLPDKGEGSKIVIVKKGDGELFPIPKKYSDSFVAVIYDKKTATKAEIIHVTKRIGDKMLIVRAREGTKAQYWEAGDIFSILITAKDLEKLIKEGNEN